MRYGWTQCNEPDQELENIVMEWNPYRQTEPNAIAIRDLTVFSPRFGPCTHIWALAVHLGNHRGQHKSQRTPPPATRAVKHTLNLLKPQMQPHNSVLHLTISFRSHRENLPEMRLISRTHHTNWPSTVGGDLFPLNPWASRSRSRKIMWFSW